MAKFDQIANALSGFGAGVAGRGSEFIAGIDNRKKMLSEERKTAAAQDLYKAHLMLDQEIKNANAGGGPINLGPLNAFAETRVGAINKLGGDPSDTMAEMASINNDPLAALEAQRQGLMMAQSQGYIALPANFGPAKPTPFQQNISGLSPEDQQAALRVKAGLQPVAVKKTLTEKQQNLQNYMPEGITWENSSRRQRLQAQRSFDDAKRLSIVLPPELTEGMSPEQKTIAKQVYRVAGGGGAGLEAVNKAIGSNIEATKLKDLPKTLDIRFPNATKAERAQIDAEVSSATSASEGLEIATALRENQRNNDKGQVFQKRAIKLLTRVLGSDELNDVLGSVEGAIDFRIQDNEASLISDINEISNILTSDNLDLLTGVLTDKDMDVLRDLSAGALVRTRSSDLFKADATSLLNSLKSKLVETVNDLETGSGAGLNLPLGQEMLEDKNGIRAIVDVQTQTVIREL